MTVILVVGVVALSALDAQTAFSVHSLEGRVSALRDQRDVLATRAAELSSPSRIALWAKRYRMVLATDVVILRVRGSTSTGAAP